MSAETAEVNTGAKEKEGYGTFEGVFIPTLLTILGVIMYLREGWVVGNAGLGGAIVIILLAFGITAAIGWFPESTLDMVPMRVEATRSACLFCRDAGFENALA